MARNLLKAGFDVAGYARRAQTAEAGRAAGIEMRDSPAALAADRDFIVTMVTTSEDVARLLEGEDGLLRHARPGTVFIDMSTIAPETSRRLYEQARAADMDFLDAPVTGGSLGAEMGTLTIMVGGDDHVLERARPVLAAMGNPERIFHAGPSGAGEVVKLVNNTLAATISAATLQALAAGVGAGVPLATIVEIVSAGSGGSPQLNYLALRGLKGDFTPGFFTELMLKDLRLFEELAAGVGQTSSLNKTAIEEYLATVESGHARDDYSSLAQVVEQRTGVRLRLD